ncbi:TPA: hypothetical protein ACT5CR_006037 [Burkholderia cenocepacia]
MNQSEFAALHCVSRKTVTKWKERGWLVFAGDEVNVEESNKLLKRYRRDGAPAVTQGVTQPPEGNKRKSVTQAASEVTLKSGESADEAAERILTGNVQLLDFDEARCFKENYLGLKAQLEYDRDSGLVVDVSEVAKAVGTEYAKVRTRLLSIPAEQAPRLHRCKTPAELQDMLQEVITEALEELTRDGAGNPT